MAESDTYCLQMEEFQRNIGISWQELQIETDFCDVTLACEDKQIKTHKLIVSAFSPVLRNILKLNQNPHPLIYLRRVRYKDLQNLLNFMYQGEINVAKEDLPSFLEVAEDLNIKGLCEVNNAGYNSKVKRPPQLTYKATSEKKKTTSKKKKTKENVIIENVNEPNSIEPFKDFEQVDEDFDDRKDSISTIESEIKPEEDGDNNLSINEPNGIDPFNNFEQVYEDSDDNDSKDSNSTIESEIIKKEENGEERKFLCGKCDYKTKNKSHLKKHIESIHKGIRYPCDYCDYQATQKSRLKAHVESIHEGVRHPCGQCDYSAALKTSLRKHLLKYHSGQ